jgi:hypothetical protein
LLFLHVLDVAACAYGMEAVQLKQLT